MPHLMTPITPLIKYTRFLTSDDTHSVLHLVIIWWDVEDIPPDFASLAQFPKWLWWHGPVWYSPKTSKNYHCSAAQTWIVTIWFHMGLSIENPSPFKLCFHTLSVFPSYRFPKRWLHTLIKEFTWARKGKRRKGKGTKRQCLTRTIFDAKSYRFR